MIYVNEIKKNAKPAADKPKDDSKKESKKSK